MGRNNHCKKYKASSWEDKETGHAFKSGLHYITESFRLEKTSKTMESSHKLSSTTPTLSHGPRCHIHMPFEHCQG